MTALSPAGTVRKYPNRHFDVSLKLGTLEVPATAWDATASEPMQYRIELERIHKGFTEPGLKSIGDLRGVLVSDMPDATHISLYMPKLCFSPIDHIGINNSGGACTMEVTATIYYDQWHLSCNLSQFAARYCAEMEAHTGEFHSANVTTRKEEGLGIAMVIKTILHQDDDLHKSIEKVERFMSSAYRNSIRLHNAQMETQGSSSTQWHDTNGIQRWLERVVVPVVTSGSLALIVGWFLGRSA